MSEWYGELRSGWASRYLSQTCDEQSNKNVGNQEGNVLSLSYGQIIRKNNKYAGLTPNDFSTYQIVEPGNIILRLTDLQNDHTSLRTGLVRERGIITSAYCCLKPWENPDFLHYLLHAYDTQKYFYGLGGGVRQSIGFKDIRYVHLPYPPREEQDQIVRYLDWKVSQINRLINAKKKQIELLQEQKRAMINEAVTKGMWKRTALKRLLSTPMSDGPHESPEFFDEGIPFVSAEASHDGRIWLEECRGYISREQHEKYCLKVKPQRNDIFIVKSGSTTGKTVMVDVDDEFSIWSPLALVRCKSEHEPKFVFYYLSSEAFQKQVRDNWSFGTQPNIGMGVLQNLFIPIPTRSEQEKTVKDIETHSFVIDKAISKIRSQILTLHEYRTRIVSDVVTGKMDVRGVEIPKYEAVEETVVAEENAEE